MNILVTGANGFVGLFLTRYLKDKGHDITIIQRSNVFEKIESNKDYDCLIHLAGRAHVLRESALDSYQAFKEANVDYTLKIAKLARQLQIKRFIFISSIGVNGRSTLDQKVFTESDKPHPHNPYAQTKLEAEQALETFFKGSATALTIIRPPLVYGPNPKANFKTLLSLCRCPLPLPFAAIHNNRSFVSVDNLSHFIELCCTHPAAANQTFLISDDHDVSITELVAAIRKAFARPTHLFPVPYSVLRIIFTLIGKRSLNEQLLANLQIDTSKAKQLLSWQPLISFNEGIERAVARNAT